MKATKKTVSIIICIALVIGLFVTFSSAEEEWSSYSENDFTSSTGIFSGEFGTHNATGGYVKLSNNSTSEPVFGNDINLVSYGKVKISLRARINSFSGGPAAISGGADMATLGMKINFGDARVLWTAEETYVAGCKTGAPWGKKVDTAIGNSWHTYDVVIDLVTRNYSISVDGTVVLESTIQEGGNRPVGVNFYSIASAETPVDIDLDYVNIYVTERVAGGEEEDEPTVDVVPDTVDVKTLLIGKSGGNSASEYYVYRIPGIIVTSKDTVITYFEARTTASDNGGMDIIAMRSTNGGDSFSEPVVLVEGTDTGITVNNPVMIVEGDTIHFIYCINYGVCNDCVDSAKASCESHGGGGVYYCKSIDDGVSWSTPVNISDSTRPDTRYMIATGPGTGIVTKDGVLICPLWLVLKDSSGADPSNPLQQYPNDISMLYSLDHGATWQMGEVIPKDRLVVDSAMEAIAVNLSDGRVMFNIRSFEGYRSVAISDNGYSGFSEMALDTELVDPGCHAGIASYTDADGPYTLLFTNCENSTIGIEGRTNIVLKGSVDNGDTWTLRTPIDTGSTGYSAVAVDSKGTVYVVYEVQTGKAENLARINMKDFSPYEKQESINISGIYTEGETKNMVSVKLSWSDTVFRYTSEREWDTTKYEVVETGGTWSGGPLKITVENRSDLAIGAGFSFKSVAVDRNTVKSEITGTFDNESLTLAAANTEGITIGTVNFTVTGGSIYSENTGSLRLGNITVTISVLE